MKLGFVSDSLGGMPFTKMLDNAARMKVSGVEVNTCGWSTAPHFRLSEMLGNASAQLLVPVVALPALTSLDIRAAAFTSVCLER